jgi:DNA (cytosine-5)-methyltransferase 1
MRRPRLLDLFCGAGGCSVGYHRAGFDVVGVDTCDQPNYPFEFHRADAVDVLMTFLACGHYHRLSLRDFAAIHASPPCQAYTVGRHIHDSGDRHPDLVDPVRDMLIRCGKPWVIENVPGAPMSGYSAVLCGLMFGLRVLRHRLFESSFLLMTPPHPRHPSGSLTGAGTGYSTGREGFVCVAGNNFVREAGAAAMGIDWMKTRRELANAIPPAYCEFVGRQLLEVART